MSASQLKWLQPNWPAPQAIKAYTTTKQGWGETADLKNTASTKALQHLFKLPTLPLWLKQEHTADVIEVPFNHLSPVADASYTQQTNQICAVLTADCLPILICNRQGTQVAAIHAGWRGLAKGIIKQTLKAMQLPSDELLVWLGPAIGPQKFEVGKDVYQAFTEKCQKTTAAFTVLTQEKWLADLYSLARIQLQDQGLHLTQIYGGQCCTYTQSDLFFSYRRDHGQTGRMASLIWIQPEV